MLHGLELAMKNKASLQCALMDVLRVERGFITQPGDFFLWVYSIEPMSSCPDWTQRMQLLGVAPLQMPSPIPG